jgi:hypothetical protein
MVRPPGRASFWRDCQARTSTRVAAGRTAPLRLLINSPYIATDNFIEPLLKGAVKVTASLFGANIPPENISGRIERDRLMLEFRLPPSLKTSESNWLPDGKTPAWYLREIQNDTHYDPTSGDWKNLASQEKQVRRRLFEVVYKASFGGLPSYTADGNPMIPQDMPDLGGLSASGRFREFFAQKIPGRNFLTYSKLVARNCM